MFQDLVEADPGLSLISHMRQGDTDSLSRKPDARATRGTEVLPECQSLADLPPPAPLPTKPSTCFTAGFCPHGMLCQAPGG